MIFYQKETKKNLVSVQTWGNDLVLTVERLVGCQNSDLSPGHLLLVDAHCLHNVVHLTFHLT